MRIAFLSLVVVHALLHLLGFLKSWGLAALPELSGKTLIPLSPGALRTLGLAWLLASMTLLGAALLRGLRLDSWWIVAGVGVVLSQVLIVLQWQDAKAGTLANLLIAGMVVLTFVDARFQDRVERRVDLLLGDASTRQE